MDKGDILVKGIVSVVLVGCAVKALCMMRKEKTNRDIIEDEGLFVEETSDESQD